MTGADRVILRGLRAKTRIGVTDEERSEAREVVIDLEIDTDLARAGVSDELGDTIDYAAVARRVTELVGGTEARLLEHLAHQVAEAVLVFAGVEAVRVEITKESPPMAEDVAEVGVVVHRSNEALGEK